MRIQDATSAQTRPETGNQSGVLLKSFPDRTFFLAKASHVTTAPRDATQLQTQEQTLTSAEKNTTKSSITTRSKIKEKIERLGLK